ncbi:MAG: type II secretion system protein GspN [Candidatus Lambdaproteobacteria bacterium]|nr:type II secretion system protein GspN [Candidatus Lambdaproteobacteria bacterium]
MRTLLWILAALFLFAVSFWAGLVSHFPGAALSRYLEGVANRDPRLSVRIAPAELGWTRLLISQIRVDGNLTGQPTFLLALNDTEIPLSWGLLGGLSLRTGLGGSGVVELYWPWKRGEASFSARDLKLEGIPALAQLPAQRIQGRVELSGTARVRPGQMPEGRVRGRIQGLEIGGMQVLGQTVEATRLESVEIQAAFGAQLRVESLSAQGDIQGSLSGTVAPNPARPELSALDLQIDVGLRPEWVQQLGPLAPVAESLLDNGRLAGVLRGTPARPLFRNTRSRS